MKGFSPAQVFVEDDMVVFGYGGFYERPKGWGLDLCYFHKSEFAWLRGRGALLRRIRAALAAVEQQRMAEGFVSQLIRRLQRLTLHEWHYDRAELMFQTAKTQVHTMARFGDFPAFLRMVMPAAFCTPAELETRVTDYLRTVIPHEDPLERVDGQNRLLFGFLLKAIEADLCEWLGGTQGEWLMRRLVEIAPQPPRGAESLDDFMARLFAHPAAEAMLLQWHRSYFATLAGQEGDIRRKLRSLRPLRADKRAATRARAATLAEAKRGLPAGLCRLMRRLEIPVFVATGPDLGYFRDFHQPGFLVYKQTGTMHRMTGLGLCVHRSAGRGGVFLTYDRAQPARFVHTLLEECTHFADGPQDRMTMRGGARYSETPAFAAALAADRALHGPWRNARALGLREWGLVLVQMRLPARRVAQLQQRLEAYGATLDFRHYDAAEELAESFAALPVVERALGRKLARQVMPHMFAYYDEAYRAGLRAELAQLRQ